MTAPPRDEEYGFLLEVLEKIGQGSFADVFLARESRAGREVALKLFHPWGVSPGCETPRIFKEDRLLAYIHHSNVVTVHGAVHHEGGVGIWMELIEGATLRDIVNAEGPLDTDQALSVARDVCCGLAAVPGSGAIHRDIKAGNVRREKTGRIVRRDLGISCEMDRRRTGGKYATPLFAASEVMLTNDNTLRGDLYSVGS